MDSEITPSTSPSTDTRTETNLTGREWTSEGSMVSFNLKNNDYL